MNRIKVFISILGLLSILLGSTYIFGMYGPTEIEVAQWGLVECIVGFLLMGTGLIISERISVRIFIGLVLLFNLMMQVLPAILWFVFNGTGISDGSPHSAFVASWIYSLPHIIIGLMSMASFLFITVMFKKVQAKFE